jgi:membrane dipeptidase
VNLGNFATDSYEEAIRYFAYWNGFIAAYPDHLLRIGAASDFTRAKQSGKLGLLFGTQDGIHFRAPDDVDLFYGLGQRVSQLTYNFRNRIGNGAFERRDDGLSDFGISIVERMNKIGMAVDLGHAGERTMFDTLEASRKPVIISHGNSRMLAPSCLRCVTDEAIRRMAKTGGVIGVNFISFMVKDREPTTPDDVIDHIDHISKLVGIEHVGIGSDFGIESNNLLPPDDLQKYLQAVDKRYHVHKREAVDGLHHSRRFYDLTEALIRRRYSDENIKLILGENFRRALNDAWQVG